MLIHQFNTVSCKRNSLRLVFYGVFALVPKRYLSSDAIVFYLAVDDTSRLFESNNDPPVIVVPVPYAVPYTIFYEGLQDHGWNKNFVGVNRRIYRDFE